MAEFHETRMGRDFYDKTMPALVKAIDMLAKTLTSSRNGALGRSRIKAAQESPTMAVNIEGHDCSLFGDRDGPTLRKLSFDGRVRWLEARVTAMLLRPLETLRPKDRGRTEEDLHSLLAFGTLLFDGVEALGSYYCGRDGNTKTFKRFVGDYFGEAYRDCAESLREDFRNGLAHGFAVKKGGFEFPESLSGPEIRADALQLDPDQLLDDLKNAVSDYFKSVRRDGEESELGTAFSRRFESVFGVS